jgi:hypothetical protein
VLFFCPKRLTIAFCHLAPAFREKGDFNKKGIFLCASKEEPSSSAFGSFASLRLPALSAALIHSKFHLITSVCQPDNAAVKGCGLCNWYSLSFHRNALFENICQHHYSRIFFQALAFRYVHTVIVAISNKLDALIWASGATAEKAACETTNETRKTHTLANGHTCKWKSFRDASELRAAVAGRDW